MVLSARAATRLGPLSLLPSARVPAPRPLRSRPPFRVFLCSHDGYGLGHLRRNTLIAAAIEDAVPGTEATLVTGSAVDPGWAESQGLRVLQLPPLVKDRAGVYRGIGMDTGTAMARRARLFRAAVATRRPDLVLVDRHPYGTDGELRAGLQLAAEQGAVLLLGLRDVLDEPAVIRDEVAGRRWDGVPELFDEVIVYGSPQLVDHEREYGLPVRPRYVGWVAGSPPAIRRVPRQLAVTAGGGGDGAEVFRLAADLLRGRPDWTGVLAAGPFAEGLTDLAHRTSGRIRVVGGVRGCAGLYAGSEAAVMMAGYNSTLEALSAGLRPVLVPRRRPRREQAIRASRLASWGLADVVDAGADAEEIAWLLDQPRTVRPGALARVGMTFDGAARTAARIGTLLATRSVA